MKNHEIIPYSSKDYLDFLIAMQQSFVEKSLPYSLFDLQVFHNINSDEIYETMLRAIEICDLMEVDSRFHFKKVYIFNIDKNVINIDWQISKKGLNLVMMHLKSRNKKNAMWMWQLADR